MAIVWLIEQSRTELESLVGPLSSNYAVRLIATPASALQLLAICDPLHSPSLLVVNDISAKNPLEALAYKHGFKSRFSNILVAVSSYASEAWRASARESTLILRGNPEDPFEILKDIKALVERSAEKREADSSSTAKKLDQIQVGDVLFDRRQGAISVSGHNRESLSPKEAKILETLIERVELCVTRNDLSGLVWPGVYVSDRTLDSHISRLRRKLKVSADCTIEAIYGQGYRLKVGD